MPRMTGAKAVIATLRAHGVDTVFGIPGVHTLPLYDKMRAEPALRHVLARHEQGAGFMAEGYARASGRPGVVCTITGPGVTNVATPAASAYADSIPLLIISTSLPRAATRRPLGLLHEVKDQFGVMASLVGWSRAVESVEELPDALRDALRALASGRPRGAYLQIPLDLLELEADIEVEGPRRHDQPVASPTETAEVVRLLSGARRPLIVAGAGVTMSGANEALRRLAERLHAPVLLGSKSRDVLPSDHPLVLATSGYALPAELRALSAQSDVALVVGSKLGVERIGAERLELPATIVQIDLDPAEIGRQYPVQVGIVGDARAVIEGLLETLPEGADAGENRGAEIEAAREAILAGARRGYGESLDYLDALHEALPRDGVVVADMTMLGYASAEYLPVYSPRSYVHPSELCTIGCGLPLALGAKVAVGGRPVVALCGDGGFLVNAGELATAVQERIAAIIVVFNDATYTAVKSDQKHRFGGRYYATDLVAPDYVAMARAFGAIGVRADSPAALGGAIHAALGSDGPTLIEVPLPPLAW